MAKSKPELARKWLRRILAFLCTVVSHGWTLIVTVLGSFVLSIPAWITPLLPVATAGELNACITVAPLTYEYLAGDFFICGLFYASFLAWNEERDEVVSLNERALSNRPSLCVYSSGYTCDIRPLRFAGVQQVVASLRFNIEVINSGGPTSLRNWGGWYKVKSGNRVFLGSAMFDSELSNDNSTNLIADERILDRGGRRLGWVQFGVTEQEPTSIEQVTITFEDHTGAPYAVAAPPDALLRGRTT